MGSDSLSASLLRFKNALQYDLQAWIDCAVNELGALKIPNEAIVMRALCSTELKANYDSETALDKLGRGICERFDLSWMPDLIAKPKPTRPLKLLSSADRREELKQAYYLSSGYFDFNDKKVLLLDDILTTGATVTAIIMLVKEYFPQCMFKVFTLAKSSYDETNQAISLSGTDFAWTNETGWLAAEEEGYFGSYEQLTRCILTDDFANL